MNVVGPYAVILGVAADRDVGDGRFAAEGAVLAIEAERFEGSPIKFVPGFGRRRFGRRRRRDLVGIFSGQPRQPVGGARRAGYAVAEGASEFFSASSTNSSSIWPT